MAGNAAMRGLNLACAFERQVFPTGVAPGGMCFGKGQGREVAGLSTAVARPGPNALPPSASGTPRGLRRMESRVRQECEQEDLSRTRNVALTTTGDGSDLLLLRWDCCGLGGNPQFSDLHQGRLPTHKHPPLRRGLPSPGTLPLEIAPDIGT